MMGWVIALLVLIAVQLFLFHTLVQNVGGMIIDRLTKISGELPAMKELTQRHRSLVEDLQPVARHYANLEAAARRAREWAEFDDPR